jgi:hypothetical protein
MANMGFLLVMMQPPPTFEEEFNAWYDSEHVPERLAVPGFAAAQRFICVSGAPPRYLAMYDLEREEVLDTPEYNRVSGANFSPWTKRVTSRVRIYRSAGQQVYPGNLITGRCARVLVLRFRALGTDAEKAVVAGMKANFEAKPETIQVRVFAYPTPDGIDYIGFVEARGIIEERLNPAPFGCAADAVDLINTYAPY